MNKVAAIQKLNDREIELGIAGTSASWHEQYHDNPTIYIGGLSSSVDEQAVLSIFEQYGTIVHVNIVRDSATGAARGFAFVQYDDPRSAILAVDNLNGFYHDGRTFRVDHVDDYKRPEDPEGVMDTTPIQPVPVSTAQKPVTSGNSIHPVSSDRPDAELRRELAVMDRLKALQKRRRSNAVEPEHGGPSNAANQNSSGMISGSSLQENDEISIAPPAQMRVQERQRRHAEKEKRRLQRAAIRSARAERRAERNNR